MKTAPEHELAAPEYEELRAACGLLDVPQLGTLTLDTLREQHQSLAAALDLLPSELAQTPGLRPLARQALAETPDVQERGERILERCQKMGVQVFLRGRLGYPPLLDREGAPWVLYVLGELEPAGSSPRRVAVVGARRADDYGQNVTCALVRRLVSAGVEVVSGGAQGVDSFAHQEALSAGARTVAVLGIGLAEVTKTERARLLDAVAAQGAVVSEFPLDSAGFKGHFPRRNRTIAGLSEAVVLTRGSENSGALHTCRAAQELGRGVFAVPGDVNHPLSAAPHGLLRAGSGRITLDGSEVLGALGLGSGLPLAQSLDKGVQVDEAAVPKQARAVFKALRPSPMHVDDIAEAAGMAVGDTLAALLLLEMAGLCQARPGKVFLRP